MSTPDKPARVAHARTTAKKKVVSDKQAKQIIKANKKKRVPTSLRQKPKPTQLMDINLKLKFLEGMVQFGTIRGACKHSGVSGTLYYYWTDPKWTTEGRHYDEDFVHEVALAKEAYRDVLRMEMHRRAVKGVLKPVFGSLGYREGSGIIGHVREYSDRILELMAKMNLPEAKPEGSGSVINVDARSVHQTNTMVFDPTKMTQKQRDLMRQLLESADDEDSDAKAIEVVPTK